ncbi:MAG: 4-(cytidine 5'-diphospho)-2-C-methyl-D-erythritol kinase [Oscillospiraceae bacterium]|jgi:4-diphosphocytidyl-2-C-methyl-D-erythritol kinase|nr:4-(cytidine 5'-diphospho)-2-C-methyl-D-erythritol kinase [Oscillospiraceae bacterium]
MKITCRAYAKLNLHLDVAGRLPSGYHNVAMLMQSVSLHDTVTVETTERPGIEIVCDKKGIPGGAENIAWRAVQAFFGGAAGELANPPEGLRVALQKQIPAGAGLAGGSADAAAVLTALQKMYAPDMPGEALRAIGARVGADVPFCLLGGCCWAEGVGDQLTPLPCLPAERYRVWLAKPDQSIATGGAYAKIDARGVSHPASPRSLAAQGAWPAVFPLCANVFEQVTELPGLAEAKADCSAAGALLTQMTGSGSAVFAVGPQKADWPAVAGALKKLGAFCVEVRPVPCGVAVVEPEK